MSVVGKVIVYRGMELHPVAPGYLSEAAWENSSKSVRLDMGKSGNFTCSFNFGSCKYGVFIGSTWKHALDLGVEHVRFDFEEMEKFFRNLK